MSLVAYGSSDESSDEEEANDSVNNVDILIKKTRTVLSLPAPKDAVDPVKNSQPKIDNDEINVPKASMSTAEEPVLFKNLPKPKHIEISPSDETEDDIIPPKKDTKTLREKSLRKNRTPVKISLPSLSEFKDVEEEQEERKRNRIKPSEKGTGLFSILPPPKGSTTKATIRSLIPDVVKRVLPSRQVKTTPTKTMNPVSKKTDALALAINYDSDSEDESSSSAGNNTKRKLEGKADFFSLANSSGKISPSVCDSGKDFFSLTEGVETSSAKPSANSNALASYKDKSSENVYQGFDITDQKGGDGSEITGFTTTMECGETQGVEISDKTLTSNVMNLPKEEIRMKNKAEVGPKLPIPEQEYNVDSQGNVAFDEKAIEYLCGKRGVKRKNKDFDEANIIEINGEDIKPDEREWLVKALTEESAERPVSMESAGPSTQSRKKHQITYLAHQAKAMEVELKNQWAQNRVTRKQTQSKYGF